MNISREVEKYMEALTTRFPEIQSCWLIGSRANGTSRLDSDWNLLVFADQEVFDELRKKTLFKRGIIKLFVVFDGENLEEPWPEGDEPKKGSLASWEWNVISNNEATYKPLECKDVNQFFVTSKNYTGRALKAKKLWPR